MLIYWLFYYFELYTRTNSCTLCYLARINRLTHAWPTAIIMKEGPFSCTWSNVKRPTTFTWNFQSKIFIYLLLLLFCNWWTRFIDSSDFQNKPVNCPVQTAYTYLHDNPHNQIWRHMHSICCECLFFLRNFSSSSSSSPVTTTRVSLSSLICLNWICIRICRFTLMLAKVDPNVSFSISFWIEELTTLRPPHAKTHKPFYTLTNPNFIG